jgi:AraC-like DNA-binding protein
MVPPKRIRHVSRDVVSVEVDNPVGPITQWEDALSRCVGRVSPDFRDQEITRCVPGAGQAFQARLEYGGLGDAVLFKTSATPHYFARSLRYANANLPSPIVLGFQSAGSARVRQDGISYVLHPGDWSLWDTLVPVETWAMTGSIEFLSVTLSRPSDPELQRLLSEGSTTRLDGKIGVSRVLQRTLTEIFDQMGRISPASGEALRTAVTAMAWEALREQVGAPASASTCRDVLISRAKAYIEAHLADPGLAVAEIADGCGISVRGIHRAFARDPAGSVSRYIWGRRLSRCADALRNGGEASHRITEICLSWGFNSSSHFSRLFKEQFGMSPRLYRARLGLDPAHQR